MNAPPSRRQTWVVAVAGELVIAVLIAAVALWEVAVAAQERANPELPAGRGSLPPSAAARTVTAPITFATTCWPAPQPVPGEDFTVNPCAQQQGKRVMMRIFVASPTERAVDVYLWTQNGAGKKLESRAVCASMQLSPRPAVCGDFFSMPTEAGPWNVAVQVLPAGATFSKEDWLKPETTGFLSKPFTW